MKLFFRRIVSTICLVVIHRRTDAVGDFQKEHTELVEFVLAQHQRMPDFLRFPIFVLTIAFEFYGFVTGGTLFHRLPPEAQWQQMETWRNAPFSFCRDLMRFYESLTLFGWYAKRSPVQA